MQRVQRACVVCVTQQQHPSHSASVCSSPVLYAGSVVYSNPCGVAGCAECDVRRSARGRVRTDGDERLGDRGGEGI